MSSFGFHCDFCNKKSQKPLWALGFRRHHLFRSAIMAGVQGFWTFTWITSDSGVGAQIDQTSQRKKETDHTRWSVLFFGWGAGIRTPEMSESESDALPLGDTPIFSTDDIISHQTLFVNTYFKLFWKNYSLFFVFQKNRLFLLYKCPFLWYNTKVRSKSTRGTAG